jgi:hypothetical protein
VATLVEILAPLCEENARLRELLAECRPPIDGFRRYYVWGRSEQDNSTLKNLLHRIDAALQPKPEKTNE